MIEILLREIIRFYLKSNCEELKEMDNGTAIRVFIALIYLVISSFYHFRTAINFNTYILYKYSIPLIVNATLESDYEHDVWNVPPILLQLLVSNLMQDHFPIYYLKAFDTI